jgi:hypothetical protein
MPNKTIVFKVAGVTYENRQDTISIMHGSEPCRIVPEPTNAYDPNALAVIAIVEGSRQHIGYVPKELAKLIAPHLDGEQVDVKILEITGGFGDFPIYGLRLRVEVPESEYILRTDDSDVII